jgi:metallo-beta-lactamase family protein
MMTLTSYGAAQEVTGSKHLLEVGGSRILIDCGMFQGRRKESRAKNEDMPFDPATVTACINTHGHLDHCGAYPVLVKRGFRGLIWATAATVDVAQLVMADAARIQVADARYLERVLSQNPRDRREVVPPLYDEEDAAQATGLFRPVAYRQPVEIAPGVTATFLEAGHILGSAVVRLDVVDGDQRRTIVFTGDLGRRNTPILRDPDAAPDADWLVCESTYGNRLHDDLAFAQEELAAVVRDTVAKGGRVLIPAFAVGRTQELVWHLHQLNESGRIPAIPVYVDSPMATRATGIFTKHTECYDEETVRRFVDHGESPFRFGALKFTASAEDSKKLNDVRGPCIVIASSGMCEAGRILHHLVRDVGDPRNTILVVGFMAEHTLGRALADRRPEVRIFGEPHRLEARVKILNAFSAHADRNEIGEWVAPMDQARLKGVLLVHGEPVAQASLGDHLRSLGVRRVESLVAGRSVSL